MKAPLKDITTNVITGFLGVGKTTAILNLLKHKPANQRWSVLVNEAGKIGVDGKLIEQAGIAVKQVPGGCMCCAAGLPMQVAINKLIKETRPQRLLIEPSGMGHPRNILNTLAAPEYQGVLDLRACICLIDPRNLSEQRYIDSELFIDQVAIADVVIANKTDQCSTEDRERFNAFIDSLAFPPQATGWVTQGDIKTEWLDMQHQPGTANRFRLMREPASGLSTFSKSFPIETTFDQECLLAVIKHLQVQRLKAIVNTENGAVFINSVNGQTSVSALDVNDGYLMEIVDSQTVDGTLLMEQLEKCKN
jgi:G3E family GTPase